MAYLTRRVPNGIVFRMVLTYSRSRKYEPYDWTNIDEVWRWLADQLHLSHNPTCFSPLDNDHVTTNPPSEVLSRSCASRKSQFGEVEIAQIGAKKGKWRVLKLSSNSSRRRHLHTYNWKVLQIYNIFLRQNLFNNTWTIPKCLDCRKYVYSPG